MHSVEREAKMLLPRAVGVSLSIAYMLEFSHDMVSLSLTLSWVP